MMTKPPDILVIGAGVFGLSSAFELLRAGYRVTVLDKSPPASGASGGILGALSPHLPDAWNSKKDYQLRALMAAPAFWHDIETYADHLTGYGQIGRMMPLLTQKARDLAQMRIEEAKLRWPSPLEWQIVDTPDTNWIAEAPFGAVHETLSARIFPRAACKALAKAVQSLGGLIEQDDVRRIDGTTALLGSGQTRTAEKIILAAGFESFALAGFPCDFGTRVKGQAALLEGATTTGPLLFTDGFYILPHDDGRVAIGSTSEAEFDDAHVTDEALTKLITRARIQCPALKDAQVVERWAGIRPRASLPDPILGPLPDNPDVIIASGGFKIGFGLAPEVARTMTRIVAGQQVDLPPSFTPAVHLAHAAR